MVKHTQTFRRQFAEGLFECVWPFCDIGTERVKSFSSCLIHFFSLEKQSIKYLYQLRTSYLPVFYFYSREDLCQLKKFESK